MDGRAEAEILQRTLLERQRPDGSWGFQGKTSWTEPTALALLALGLGDDSDVCRRATRWLRQSQRPDGGWSPQPQVGVSTWLTSLATLALLHRSWPETDRGRALGWLQAQVKPEESLLVQFVAALKHQPTPEINRYGSSWYPGTAAWIFPTAITVLTFQEAARLTGSRHFLELASRGQQYILSRRCSDGGWNHGGSRLANEEPVSYPETTGLALLALGGVPDQEIRPSIAQAQRSLRAPLSGEGLCWLQLGLAAHGFPLQPSEERFVYRSPRDMALRLLALSANDPRNFLVARHSL